MKEEGDIIDSTIGMAKLITNSNGIAIEYPTTAALNLNGAAHWNYGSPLESTPTVDSLSFKMYQLEEKMNHLRDQMRVLAEKDKTEKDKKHSPRKLGSKE